MANKLSSWRCSFKPRVLGMILLLLIAVFVTIFLSFNFFINSYIKTNIASQLNAFWNIHGQYNLKQENDGRSYLPDMSKQPKNKIGVKTEAFVMDEGYHILNLYGNEDNEKLQESEQVASYLKEHKSPLEEINNLHLRTQDEDYYISITNDPKQESSFIIFYVNATMISSFADTINFLLIVVMLIAAILSFFIAALIANSVTKPVRQLSSFARQIGCGDFTVQNFSYTDKEFKELADVMNQTVRQLSNYDSEQKTFFQNVSHELRTPLMSIKCYAEGIEYGLMENVKSSRIISEEVDRLSEMVEDLLCISRINNITENVEMQENDLRETFSLCAENLKSIADKANIKLIYDFAEAPVLFKYNDKYMYRALSNLITNALRYAKSQIILVCKNEGKTVKLSVADDGEGISADALPYIFERFYKGKSGKHGIGLSIVKSVVNLHGGKISVTINNGTCFLIEFDYI
ncbi:MAG: sensor histidine kinase [Ruminiclostridium sp.]